MSVAGDIWESWRAPRRVIRRQLAAGVREDRALAYLMLGCALIFVSEWPVLLQAAAADPAVGLDVRLGGAMLAWLGLMPLALYGVAALSHLAARALGGQGSYYGARLALFWALLGVAPLWLAYGAVTALAAGPAAALAGAVALAGLAWLWLSALAEVERGAADALA